MSKKERKYSGPDRTGICVCGCSWKVHHQNLVMNEEYIKATEEAYILGECDAFGFNEVGGKKYDEETGEWVYHCHRYKDTGAK